MPNLEVQRPHWYKITVFECPVCGQGGTYRERIYGQKPKDPQKRYCFESIYDYCDESYDLYVYR